MATIKVKQYDTSPPLDATLTQKGGTAINLSGATVKFLMRRKGSGTAKINASASIVDAATGKVRYQWATNDLDTAGLYEAEFEVVLSGGARVTVPNDEFISVVVLDDIA